MIYLVDTNILLRFTRQSDRQHPITITAIRTLIQNGHHLQVTPQNCIEFWNVATRPANKNGFGLTAIQANQLLTLIESIFPILSDIPGIYSEWRRLVITYAVSGVQVHDARLVAAMKVNNITHILTFNTTDFTRYVSEGIVAVDPTTVA
ncbi:type II toxin-antitoxin system VapC family toxin [Roseofilum sp. BLCC_M91]|uniref:Type II toxin-antitoxin system VapC family toxin n=1 Tax=Roseofilum halophilum BLCC-M91 TaxID=3022259 RepID=A0ABT7BDT6_9CYAN|nr:type II toxin-antitoxin system VapC family toxin [Roseofilum halophilum]MDJ1177348.1 type II toxin-antitoxin system VapC family toxin [Roseofilum halophilum BLCC-M91]